MAYKPSHGQAGLWKVKAPYDILLTPNTLYTCLSLQAISNFIANGESVYDRYYGPLGVSDDQYQQDVGDNAVIVGLQAGTGEMAFIPSSFIEGAPIDNGVKYIPVVLGISLGAVPDQVNLEPIIQQVKDVVEASFGIKSEVKGVVVGSPKWMTNEEHELLENARKQNISTSTSPIVEVNILRDDNEKLRRIISEYEKIFKMKVAG
jgi:hypothetical protein